MKEVTTMTEIVVQGTIADSRHIELAEPIDGVGSSVEVVVRMANRKPKSGKNLLDVLARIGQGKRTKEDVDRQIREERETWGDR